MHKDFLAITDLSKAELIGLLDLAARQKRGVTSDALAGKQLAILFEKPSLRTRSSFEVGIRELGGQLTTFSAAECGRLGERESVYDFAHVIAGFYDGLIARVFDHAKLIELANYTNIPVVNALSDREHPCQILADLLTIRETLGTIEGIKIAFLGDGNNVARSLAVAAKTLGSHFTLIGPKAYRLDDNTIEQTEDLTAGLKDADVVVTDTWASMGSESEAAARATVFAPYQLNTAALALAKKNAIVLHCLPAHRGEEITDEVIDSAHSVVFAEAANRLPVQKAVLLRLFGKA